MFGDNTVFNMRESSSSIEMANVLENIQTKVEALKTVNVVAIVKEGLTSKELAKHANNLKFLK